MAIAVRAGWLTGIRSDDTASDAHRPLHLLDIHWKSYNWTRHVAMCKAEHPALAAVPDLEDPADLPATLAMAEELAPHCDSVVVIPKCDVVGGLPREIGGVPVTLGFSVPTAYGGTKEPIDRFLGWPVHLLGGAPQRQVRLARYLKATSADGNMCQKLANKGLVMDERGNGARMSVYEPEDLGIGLPSRCLALSLRNLTTLWQSAGFAQDHTRGGTPW